MDINTEENVTAADGFTPKPVYDFFKRVFDIVCALLAMTVLSPLFVIIAAAIMADDFGSPVFVQERIGKNGKRFLCYKWRTMFIDSDKIKIDEKTENECLYVHFKMKNDPRVTRVGRFLRRTSLDETLQAVNILFNQMSVVGPRPFVPVEQEQLPYDRLIVKPGLSCYWQITDTAKMPIKEQLELDYKYIRERSFVTDMKIIFRTAEVILKRRNC